RASVLEDRRVLEIEATVPVRALTAGADKTADASAEASAEGDEAPAAQALTVEEEPAVPAVFSPEGSRLFLRAAAALARFDADTAPDPDGGPDGGPDGDGDGVPQDDEDEPAQEEKDEQPDLREPSHEDEPQERSEAVDGHERAAVGTSAQDDTSTRAETERSPQTASSGHYTVPTAVAVAPQTPVRRPVTEGGFDFFGAKRETSRAALEAVQNEDLADVVGQEALALHKAEAEARYKPADEASRGIGQVIDLTVHDETEQIDVQGLRSAVS
ncbi:hypothetical protein, partial [Streptomyces sp. NPDC056948]|uniref:hypothetical protein n=1 Tax=Streptomyces sp. NPDC056948 TaxID=3345975 RepID=UPI00362CB459